MVYGLYEKTIDKPPLLLIQGDESWPRRMSGDSSLSLIAVSKSSSEPSAAAAVGDVSVSELKPWYAEPRYSSKPREGG